MPSQPSDQEKNDEDPRPDRDGAQSRQVHRLPHLLGHLQERLDEPRRHGIRLVHNVETKPGIGYPKDWENQAKWKGGWQRKRNGRIEPRIGSKWRILANIFANPDLPEIDDYYEPFTFDYDHCRPRRRRRPSRRRVRAR